MLTIAIPTFNREESLARTLNCLRSQVGIEARLLIIDNCSTYDVSALVRRVFHCADYVRIKRQAANIGPGANLLTCILEAETPYVWLLSDDDSPHPSAVELIRKAITNSPQAVCFSFASSMYPRARTFDTSGVDDLLNRLDHFGQFLFMSVMVINRAAVLPCIKAGFEFCYTMAPHLAVVLSAVAANNGKVVFLDSELVSWNLADTAERWNPLLVGTRMLSLTELPVLTRDQRRLLSRHIDRFYTGRITRLLPGLWLLASDKRRRYEAIRIYRELTQRFAPERHSILERCWLRLLGITLRCPDLMAIGLKVILTCSGKADKMHKLVCADFYNRI